MEVGSATYLGRGRDTRLVSLSLFNTTRSDVALLLMTQLLMWFFRGLFATLQGATTNWGGMVALRFLLGVAEAGYGPGIVYLLTFF